MSLPRIKDFKGETIDMACRRCDRHGVFNRNALVKKLGGQTEFAELRRILVLGCDRLGTEGCEAMFPCLLSAALCFDRRDD